MKNTIKRTAAVILAAAMIGVGAYAPVSDAGIFSDTSITAEAASVGKVTGLTSKTLSNSQIKLSWKKVSGASGYSVCMKKNGKYPQIADVKGTSYTVNNLPNATRENFKVRAYKVVNGKKVYGAYSANRNTATNPQAAKGLKLSSADSDSVKLSWTKIGCTNYRVYQMINGAWKEVGKTTGTSYTVKNLSAQTEYSFKIRACKQDDKKANHYGKYSSVLTVSTAVGKVTGAYTNTLSNSQIKVSWNAVAGADGYIVGMRKNGVYGQVGDTSATSYVVSNLPNATRENFKVRAYKIVDGRKVYGSWSDNLTTATNPQAAKGLKVSGVTENSVKLSWTKIGCTNYRVYRMTNGAWKEIGKTTGTSYTVKNLSAGTEYQFKIRACKVDDKKANHYGAYSGVVRAATKTNETKLLTQADIDRLQKELQEYSNSKAVYLQNHYSEYLHYNGTKWVECDSFEVIVNDHIAGASPDNGTWHDLYPILYEPYTPDTPYMMINWSSDSYEELLSSFKDHLDFEYKEDPETHFVVYVENCPDGKTVDSDFYYPPCWVIYLIQ